MSYNYTLRYKTFDQLLSEILVDFENYNLEGYIEPQQLIKVAKRVNYDLGLRIMMTKEAILEVEKGRVRLPDDFFVLNYALLCGNFTVHQAMPQGTSTEEIPVTPYKQTNSSINTCADGPVNCLKCSQPKISCGCPKVSSCGTCNSDPCGCNNNSFTVGLGGGSSCRTCSSNPCSCPTACDFDQKFDTTPPLTGSCTAPRKVFMNCKGQEWEVIQKVNTTTQHIYKQLWPVKILENPETIECECPNLYMDCPNTAWIQNGWIYTNFTCGKLYISYQGMLEDDDGNLLVPDHDMLNEYYEYALKQRILENLVMNDEAIGQRMQIVEARLRTARNYALSIVNTPNFSEMKRVFNMNRKAQYAKYYDMFKSDNPFLGWNTNYTGSRSM